LRTVRTDKPARGAVNSHLIRTRRTQRRRLVRLDLLAGNGVRKRAARGQRDDRGRGDREDADKRGLLAEVPVSGSPAQPGQTEKQNTPAVADLQAKTQPNEFPDLRGQWSMVGDRVWVHEHDVRENG